MYQSQPIQYGTKVQQPIKYNNSAPISDEQTKCVQESVGTFVWYSRARDPTLAESLSAISSRQTKGIKDVMDSCHQLLDYLATHPDAAIWYHVSDMILDFDTDDSYISELGGKIRAAAYYYMTNKGQKEIKNGTINVLSTIIKHVMYSASEVETGALYYGCKRAIPYRAMLQ